MSSGVPSATYHTAQQDMFTDEGRPGLTRFNRMILSVLDFWRGTGANRRDPGCGFAHQMEMTIDLKRRVASPAPPVIRESPQTY
jgi:hypothetical protein